MNRFSSIRIVTQTIKRASKYVQKYSFALTLSCCLTLMGLGLYHARTMPAKPMVPDASPAPVTQSFDQRLSSTEPSALIWPVSGREVLIAHSPENALWSNTLSLWQTHSGIDISGVHGEVVRAALGGQIARAWHDPLLGYCIEMTHEKDIVTRYANLATINLVTVGQIVQAGTQIGAVGDSSAAETANGAHLHFEAWQDGQWLPLPE